MIWNGLIVTTNAAGRYANPDDRYRGVAYGDAWPLQDLAGPVPGSPESALVTKVDSFFDFRFEYRKTPPGVINDLGFVFDYAKCCQCRDIAVRVLLCATTSDWMTMDDAVVQRLLPYTQFLGYDYIGGGWDYSALYDDLYSDPPFPPLERFIRCLNTCGLFDKESDLHEYIRTRWEIIRNTEERYETHGTLRVRVTPLEDFGSFWPCDARELNWELMKAHKETGT